MLYIEQHYRDEIYRTYVTDALMVLTGNTAKYQGDKSLNIRYQDLFKPKDTRPPEEMVQDILSRAGITIESR